MTHPESVGRWLLPLGGLALSLALAAGAQAQQAVLTPEVLHRFGQTEGDAAKQAFAPPVWVPAAEGRAAALVGTVLQGGDPFPVTMYGMVMSLDSGRAYSLSLADSIGYRSTSLGAIGGLSISTHLALPDGKVFAASTNASSDPEVDNSLRGGALFHLDDLNPVRTAMPAEQSVYFQGRGQLAADGQGNVYFGATFPGASATTPGIQRALMRRNADGSITQIVDFNQFTATYLDTRGREQSYLTHGGDPSVLLWSERDQALYIASSIAGQPHYISPPDAELGGDSVKGFLVRISAAALARGNLTSDDLEVLHRFYLTRDGTPVANDTLVYGLVEDGEWLYGGSSKSPSGAVWRIRKNDPDSFQIVHAFSPDVSVAGEFSGRDGSDPRGPLVRAGDGNIYGTTWRNGNKVALSGRTLLAAGVGTVFRIKVGSAADRSDDALELLHYFSHEDVSDGSYPVGLSAGPVENGKQWLFGVTQNGGAAANGGVVYRVAIDLPPVQLDEFTVDGAQSVSVADGSRVLLAWSSTGASVCEPSGDWADSGAKAAEGSEQTAALAYREEPYAFGLTCRSDAGVVSEARQVSVTVAAPVVPEPEPEPQPEESGSDSSGGGGAAGAGLLMALMTLAGLRRRRG